MDRKFISLTQRRVSGYETDVSHCDGVFFGLVIHGAFGRPIDDASSEKPATNCTTSGSETSALADEKTSIVRCSTITDHERNRSNSKRTISELRVAA